MRRRVVQNRDVARILKSGSPHMISVALRQHVEAIKLDPIFSHKTVWSWAKLNSPRADHGFKVLIWSAESIFQSWA